MDINRSTLHTTPLFRSPSTVMSPARLGAMHQTRLSFVRTLLRKIASQHWQVDIKEWHLCPRGFGHVIYRLCTPNHVYHFVAFCNEIADEERNDRVIAEKWDVTFALIEGDITAELMTQLRDNVPRQEAGRNSNKVLVLARANKSVRVFDHIIDQLAKGSQPNPKELAEAGYILRTTAVYGNGKFGIADFKRLEDNPDFSQSFSAQMCAVYLLREFSLAWVNYLAAQQGGDHSIGLHPDLQRYLGVGNATGLGMAPYLISHPAIVDQWMTTRETALASVLSQQVCHEKIRSLNALLDKAILHLTQIVTVNERQQNLNQEAVDNLSALTLDLNSIVTPNHDWHPLLEHSKCMSFEAQEVITTCLLELYPTLVDQYQEQMNCSEILDLPSGKSVGDLIKALKEKYHWAISTDFSKPENNYWFWYRSEDKEEPRLGVRGEENGEEKELPLDVARQAHHLYKALLSSSPETPLAEFLLQHPQHRSIARRTWTLSQKSMGDIQMNVLHESALPIHLLRCKLANFGATKFDPRSDRWVRVTFYQGAPLLTDLHDPSYHDNWVFPLLPEQKNLQPVKTSRQGDAL